MCCVCLSLVGGRDVSAVSVGAELGVTYHVWSEHGYRW